MMEQMDESGQELEDFGIDEQTEIPKEAKNMAVLCHVLGLAGFAGPLVIWLLKRGVHNFVDAEGKKALNFQFSLLIAYITVVFLGSIFGLGYMSIGGALVLLLWVANAALVTVAALKAGDGKDWRYPVAIKFLR
ncbi:MAG: DUF4870 domain-containing protein [Planctomycetota bacterium]